LPTTLDQANLAREGGGGTDGGGSGSGSRQFRITQHRWKVPLIGSARYTLSPRCLTAFTSSYHAESSDMFGLFRSESAEIRYTTPGSHHFTLSHAVFRECTLTNGFLYGRCDGLQTHDFRPIFAFQLFPNVKTQSPGPLYDWLRE